VGPDPDKGHARGGPLGTGGPGQFTATGMSLKSLLFSFAYDGFYPYRYVAPVWMDNEPYDVTAKVPPGTTREQFQTMLRNLLIERFKIVFHYEPRQMTLCDLVLAKSGLKMKPSTADEKSHFPSPRVAPQPLPVRAMRRRAAPWT